MLTRRQFTTCTTVGAIASGFDLHSAVAQALVGEARMIVGFAAGGGTDASTRLFADRLRTNYAPTVIVENKVGAAARIAVEFVKNAPPDGRVMLSTPDFPVTLYPHIFKKLGYDPLHDLTPVAPMTKSVLVLSIGPSVPAEVTTLNAFIEWCKANPAKSTYATTGAGGTPHFTGVMLSNATKVAMTPVHYRGGAPALQDLVGGHVAASVNPLSEAMPLAEDGKIRMLVVASSQRSPFKRELPTLREQGVDIAVDTWSGLFLPAKAPVNIVNALSVAMEKISRDPGFIAEQAKFGNETMFEPPEQFAARIRSATENWGQIVKASGFVPQE